MESAFMLKLIKWVYYIKASEEQEQKDEVEKDIASMRRRMYIDECQNMKGVTCFDFQELLVIWRIFDFLSPFNYPHIHTFNSAAHSVD